MKINIRHVLMIGFLSAALSACAIGLTPVPTPVDKELVTPTADEIRAMLQAPATADYCMEFGAPWACITLGECTPVNFTDTIAYEMTGLPAWLTFDPDTRELCLSVGVAVIPRYTDAIDVTYTCSSTTEDPPVTASISLVINDCDGGGFYDGGEDAASAVPALVDGIGYVPLTLRNVDEYLPLSSVAGLRRIRTNMTNLSPMDVRDALDDMEDADGDGLLNLDDPAVFVATSGISLTRDELFNVQTLRAIASGDLNNDGHPDLLVSTYTFPFPVPPSPTFSTYVWNPVTGSFGAESDVTLQLLVDPATDIAVADFEGDGYLDAVAAVDGGGTIVRLRGDGSGSLKWEQSIVPGGTPSRVVAADFDADNDVDIAVLRGNIDLLIYLNNGTGTLAAGSSYLTCANSTDLATADMDADGRMDLIVSCNPASLVWTFFGDGNGQFNAVGSYPCVGEPRSVTIGDFNNDGNLDIGLSATTAGVEIQVIPCNGDRTCDAVQTFDLSAGLAMAADLDGDGDTDIAMSGGDHVILEMNQFSETGAMGFTETITALGGTGLGITLADFDGNSVTDIAIPNNNAPPLFNINLYLR